MRWGKNVIGYKKCVVTKYDKVFDKVFYLVDIVDSR